MQRIFDCHTHVFPPEIADKACRNLGEFYDFGIAGKGTYADMEAQAKANEICGFIMFSVATNAHQVQKVNSAIAALTDYSRGRGFQAVGFAGMHQDYPDFEGEIKRAAELGLFGVKIHPDIQGVDIDDKRLLPLYEILEGKMPVYFHMGDDRPQYRFSEPAKLAKIKKMFPKLVTVAAHLGGYRAWDEVCECLVGLDNILFDTSSAVWAMCSRKAKDIIGKLGAERVMFGTDYPVMLPFEELRRFEMIGLSDSENEMILYNNAARFLKL